MKEYSVEDGETVDLTRLKTAQLPQKIYTQAHEGLVLFCHDVVIEHKGGALLVVRKDLPAKNVLWPIGGRVLRGMSIEESLRKKVEEECNLELTQIKYLGVARTFFRTDPFNHNHGTDTINALYFAKGEGQLKLNALHSCPTIIKPADYTKKFRASLHPYVRDILDLTMKFIK